MVEGRVWVPDSQTSLSRLGLPIVHEKNSGMIAGNRRAGTLVVGLVVALLVLAFVIVFHAHWRTRHPVPQKSVISLNSAGPGSNRGKNSTRLPNIGSVRLIFASSAALPPLLLRRHGEIKFPEQPVFPTAGVVISAPLSDGYEKRQLYPPSCLWGLETGLPT